LDKVQSGNAVSDMTKEIPKQLNASAVTNHPGAGMQAEIAGSRYFVGTPAFIAEMTGLSLESERLQRLQSDGNTLVLLAHSHSLIGAFILGDDIRISARELIQALQQQGKSVSLLSGDHAQAVQRVANAVGIEQAQVSIAMGSVTQMARISADMILLTEQPSH
jgi:Cu2+-exporting ATPase